MGRAGIRSIQLRTPDANASAISTDSSSHPSIRCRPARFHPTVRMNLSSGSVASPNSSESRPHPSRVRKSIWNKRSEAWMYPWAK